MTLQGIGVIFFGGCFMLTNALMLLLSAVWLRFSIYNQQLLSGKDSNVTIPGKPAQQLL